MDSPTLTLLFATDLGDTFDALEAMLAIARRTGVHLSALQTSTTASGAIGTLAVHASEYELLDLFHARIANLLFLQRLSVTFLPAREAA